MEDPYIIGDYKSTRHVVDPGPAPEAKQDYVARHKARFSASKYRQEIAAAAKAKAKRRKAGKAANAARRK